MKDKEQIDQWNLADQQHEAGEAGSKKSTTILPESKTSKGSKGKSSNASKGKKEVAEPPPLISTPRAGIAVYLFE